ncbi:microsomal signal peptidase [Phycomyces nitens]|nr:microsomal signal peptidase [Phycomyces nitens]
MSIAELLECSIDFEGQRLADTITHVALIVSAVVSLIAGYSLQSLQLSVCIFLIGLGATLILVLPPWPMYNRNPQVWLTSLKEKGRITE